MIGAALLVTALITRELVSKPCQVRVLSVASSTGCSAEKHSNEGRPARPAGRPVHGHPLSVLKPVPVFVRSQQLSGGNQRSDITALEQAVTAAPNDVKSRMALADAYISSDRPMDAVAQLRTASTLAPRNPAVWYALGQAYNAVKQDALRSFGQSDTSWRALLSADALSENGHLVDAFTLYRGVQGELPAMANIHDSIARIYDRTGHPQWATSERAKGRLEAAACGARKALCEFRLGRFRTSLEAALAGSDPESRYWQARAANELALAAFKQLETLPDSPERRTIRAAVAQAEERYTDAVAELEAATKLTPRQPELLYQLASAYYSAQDFEKAITTLASLLKSYPNDPRLLSLQGQSLLQLQRADEAVPIFEQLVSRTPKDPRIRLFLGRAYFQGAYYAEAVPLLEEQLPHDSDGSVHVQLARAYTALGQRDKAVPLLTTSQELQKADEERRATLARRTITAPPR